MDTVQDMTDIDLGTVQIKAGVRKAEQPNDDSPKNTIRNKSLQYIRGSQLES